MFLLIMIVLSTTGNVSMTTTSFKSHKKCEVAAVKFGQKSTPDLRMTALCIDKGVAPLG